MENLDDNLDSPLLGDNNDSSSNNNGITLNGDSIDLRDLLLGGSVGGVGLDGHESSGNSAAAAFGRVNHHENNDCNSNSNSNEGGNSVEEERTPVLPTGGYTTEEEGPTSSGTLSLDDNRSSFTDRSRSNKKSSKSIRLGGQIMYYKARRQLSNIISYLTTQATASSDGENNYISNNIMSNNQGHDGRNRLRIITQKSSLSSSKTTPSILKLLIPPFLIINHILFLQGQTQPMWNLAYKTNITITATATTLKSKAAYDTLNLPHDYTFEHQEMKIVETFTYMDAIRKLWKGDGLGDDAQTLSKVAAALLILFSGVWPHLKLVLVHICWFVPFVHRLFLTRGATSDDDNEQQNEHYNERHLCCKSKKESTGNNNLCCSNGHFHNTSNRRSPFLRVLSTLGKWSLADILVVCILIAVLHLDWKVNPYEIRSGVENELPKIIEYIKVKYPDVNGNCEQLLGYYCEMGKALVIHYPQCLACKTLISNAYTHPEWATSEGKDIMEGIDLGGGGYAQLRVMGMVGTYYFCASVIMSILLSLVVDMYDERDRQRVEVDLMDRKSELEFILPGEEGYGGGNEEEHYDLQLSEEEGPSSSPHHQPPPSNLFHQGHHRFASPTTSSSGPPRRPAYRVTNSFHYATDNTGLRPPIPKPTTNSRLLKHVIMSLLSIMSLPFVCYAVTLPTMQRLVFGGGPALIHEVVGMVWEQEYSLITLVKTTGDAGGWDTFLMLTFGMFVVVGPILRAVCLTLNACLGIPVALLQDCIERPRHRTTVRLALYQATTQLQKALRPAIDCLGAFCSWEVLIVALIMIQLEMPSITDTIYQDDKCQEADPEHGRTCIEVQFNALDTFLVVVVSFFILTGASAFAMTLASSEDEQPLLNDENEKRYEYGQPIPQRQAAFMRNYHLNSGYNNDDEPLEQIVFI